MARKKKRAKKATKKKTGRKAKKKVAKPRIRVTITRKILGRTPKKYSFSLTDGRQLKSVYELVDELETMTEDMFNHYVTDTENHFANWIEHVFSEKHLADELRSIHSRIDAQRAILKHLVRELTRHAKT